MWWSHHDRETSLEMLRDAGFRIEAARAREQGRPRRRDLAVGAGRETALSR